MKKMLAEGFATFEKEFSYEPSPFSVCDLKIVDVNYEIPFDYFVLTNKASHLAVVEYIDCKDNKIVESGNAFIIYKIGESDSHYNFFSSEKVDGRFIMFGNERFALNEVKTNKKFTSMVLGDSAIVYEHVNAVNGLLIYKNDFFCPTMNTLLKPEFLEIVKEIIDQVNEMHFTKTFRFSFYVHSEEYFGYCVFRLQNKKVVCHVMVSALNCAKFIFIIDRLVNRTDYREIIKIFQTVPCESLQSLDLKVVNENLCVKSADDLVVSNNGLDEDLNNARVKLTDSSFNLDVNFNPRMDLLCTSLKCIKIKTIIYLLRSILLEDRIILISENANLISNLLNFIFAALQPFQYKNLKFTLLPKKLYILFDSPFPFIFGACAKYTHIKKLLKNKEITVVDLDMNKVYYRQGTKLPFEDIILERMYNESWFSFLQVYMTVIKNNIDIAKEKYVSEYFSHAQMMVDMLNKPGRILTGIKEELQPFFKTFFETKIFQSYATDEKRYKCSVNLIAYKNALVIGNTASKANPHFVYNLWYLLCINTDMDNDEDQNIFIDSLDYTSWDLGLLKNLKKYIFGFYSIQNNTEKIIKFFAFLRSHNIEIEPDDFTYIRPYGIKLSMHFFKFYDLSDYTIRINNISDFDQTGTVNDVSIEVYLKGIFIEKIKVLSIENLIYLKNISGDKFDKRYLLEKNSKVLWSMCFYFKLVGLPINLNASVKDCDYIIESNSVNSRFEPVFEILSMNK